MSITDCDGHNIHISIHIIQTLGDLGVKISCLTFRLGNNYVDYIYVSIAFSFLSPSCDGEDGVCV